MGGYNKVSALIASEMGLINQSPTARGVITTWYWSMERPIAKVWVGVQKRGMTPSDE